MINKNERFFTDHPSEIEFHKSKNDQSESIKSESPATPPPLGNKKYYITKTESGKYKVNK